jgi:hypothetical protein
MSSSAVSLLHLLPRGFVPIRYFGFLANRRRATLLPLCFQLLGLIRDQSDVDNNAAGSRPFPEADFSLTCSP